MSDVPSDFRITAMLCDSAQAINGKLYIIGGGWDRIGPQPQPTAIAMLIYVPWTESNKRHKLEIELVDASGRPFVIPTPAGEQPLVVPAEFEAGRPAGTAQGSSLTVAFAMGVGPLQLQPSQRYEWRIRINSESRDEWKLPFSVIPPPSGPVFYPQAPQS